jgi:serine/threonine protein kinase
MKAKKGSGCIEVLGCFRDEESDRPGILMENTGGQDLLSYLDETEVDENDRLRIFLLIVEALEQMHALGFVHGNLKASNVILNL